MIRKQFLVKSSFFLFLEKILLKLQKSWDPELKISKKKFTNKFPTMNFLRKSMFCLFLCSVSRNFENFYGNLGKWQAAAMVYAWWWTFSEDILSWHVFVMWSLGKKKVKNIFIKSRVTVVMIVEEL